MQGLLVVGVYAMISAAGLGSATYIGISQLQHGIGPGSGGSDLIIGASVLGLIGGTIASFL